MLLFNRYEYNPRTDLVGSGERSRVYKTLDTHQQTPLAVKIYDLTLFQTGESALEDRDTLLGLNHPNLCSYRWIEELDIESPFGQMERFLICGMDWMDAGSLVHYAPARQNPVLLRQLLEDVIRGLDHLHGAGLIHREVKASNILVSQSGSGAIARVVDFGRRRWRLPDGSEPVSRNDHWAPEQLSPAKYGIDGKESFNLDWWALGLLTYEMITGSPLFGAGDADYLENVLGPRRPEDIAMLPEPFRSLVGVCLVNDARQRVSRADELLAILRRPDVEDEDATVLLKRPPVAQAAEDTPDEDATVLLRRPTATPVEPEEVPDEDATVLLRRPTTTPVEPEDVPDEDATVLLRRPTTTPVEPEDAPDEDATVLLRRPAGPSSEPTDVPDEDATVLLPRPTASTKEPADVPDEDATVLLPRPAASTEEPEEPADVPDEDATVLLRAATPASQEPVDEDATMLLPRPTAPTEEPADAADEDATVLLPKTPATAEDKTPTAPLVKPADSGPLQSDSQPTRRLARPPSAEPSQQPQRPERLSHTGKEETILLFNRYEYNPYADLIGKGGFSRVYKAFDRRLSRWVALKIYKASDFPDRYSAIAEIQRVINLDHPNICRYLELEEMETENAFGERELTQVCVMELLSGGNFAEYYRRHKSDEVLRKLVSDVLNGLAYLHRNGIIHRDIKPANILIKETIDGPVAKITDFGISKGNEAASSGATSALIVSIPYMAPEQLNARKYGVKESVTYNLDLWSLGVALYEVITGKVLFKDNDQDSSEQIMANIVAPEQPEKLKELPQPFLDIISHCIVKDANQRAQKAEELLVLLNSSRTSHPVTVTESSASSPSQSAILEDPRPPRTEAGSVSRPSFVADKPLPEPVSADTGVSSTAKPGKSKFQIGRWEEYLKYLAIVSTAAILLLLFIRIHNANHTPADASKVVPTATDSLAHKDSSASVASSDTAAKVSGTPASANPGSPTPSAGAATPSTGTPTPSHNASNPATTGTVVTKPGPHHPSKEPPASSGGDAGQAGGTYKLELSTEKACHITLNGSDYGDIQANSSERLSLDAGKYTLKATSLTDNTSYTLEFTIKPQNLGQFSRRKINLQ